MSKSVNLRFDGGSVGQEQQSATPHTIRNLTVRDMIITESGVAYSKQVLCDLDNPIAGVPGFSPVSPEQLAQYVNAGDYIQLDLKAVMDSPESSVYRAFFNAVAFVNSSAGETTSSFNAYVLETDSRKFLNPVEVVFMVATDQLTSIQYLVVYDTRTLENTSVHDLILQDAVVVVEDSPTTKHILCDKQHKTGNSFTPVSPAKLATWISRGDYIALGTEAANDDSTASPIPMTNAVLSDGKCSQITFGGLSDENGATKFGNGVIIVDQATGIEYIHIDAINTVEADVIFLVQSNEISPYESDDEGIVKYLKTATDNEYVTAEMVKAWIDSGKLLVIKESLYVYYLTAYEDQGETESGRQYRLAFICNAFMYLTRRRLVRTYLSENAGGYSTSRMRMWSRSSSPSWYNVSEEIQDLVIENYIDIESIENPPSDIYRIINNAIPNGSIPVIRYNDAFYYFDKCYSENDAYTYSFVGKLDSDEWQTVIRVTPEGVTLGNVLGVNGTVAEGVHNSFPLGGKCGIANDDEDYPYLVFENSVWASYANFDNNSGLAYVTNPNVPVTVQYSSETIEVTTTYPALLFVTGQTVVSESDNGSGLSLPPGFIIIDKPYGRSILAERCPIARIVEAQSFRVIVVENRFGLDSGLYDTTYYVHGGFWIKSASSRGCSNALAVSPGSIASGGSMSVAFNGGKAAGPLSLANGSDAIAGGPFSSSFGHDSLAAFHHSMAFGGGALSLHDGAMVFAEDGRSGRPNQVVLGKLNKTDPDAALVLGWGDSSVIRKNIMKVDTEGNIFTGKRLDLANNIMPLFKLPDSDPASPGTEPVTGYWICDSKKQLVTAAEIKTLHAMGMKFVLCENVSPDSNSRMYVEQKSVITASTIDIEFVSVDNAMIRKVVVQKETTADVPTASLFIASSTNTYIESQWSRQSETVTHASGTFAAVTNGQLTLGQSHMLARVRLTSGDMGGGTTFTVNVQKNLYDEIEDNIVYVVNATGSTVTVAVKCDNNSHWSHGTVTINANYGAYVKVNPLYFEVINDGLVVFD